MNYKKAIFLKFLILIGCLIFFYPTISDFVDDRNSSKAVVEYNKAIDQFDKIDKEKIRKEAESYNRKIFEAKDAIYNPNLVKGYEENLNPFGDGLMGYLIIDKINLKLPIYHGVNEGVIQKSVGHLPGTSLPIGGESTHAVLSTHNGLASARLFTELHRLVLGDEFTISVLGKNLTYQVDQIKTVLPYQVEDLKVAEGKDYVTLFTCTPYGVNTHRLLVRGKRIYRKDPGKKEEGQNDAKKSFNSDLFKFIFAIAAIFLVIVSLIKDIPALRKEKEKK